MRVSINIPLKADIVTGGFEIGVSALGESWTKDQLGAYADSRGVYVLHSNGKILYIGKTTTGSFGTFSQRLRREFQESASQNSDLHQLLASQSHPIKAYLLDLQDLDMMVGSELITLSAERKALIVEQVLIGVYEPEGNKI
jgi:hypothetical protein